MGYKVRRDPEGLIYWVRENEDHDKMYPPDKWQGQMWRTAHATYIDPTRWISEDQDEVILVPLCPDFPDISGEPEDQMSDGDLEGLVLPAQIAMTDAAAADVVTSLNMIQWQSLQRPQMKNWKPEMCKASWVSTVPQVHGALMRKSPVVARPTYEPAVVT